MKHVNKHINIPYCTFQTLKPHTYLNKMTNESMPKSRRVCKIIDFLKVQTTLTIISFPLTKNLEKML